MCLFLSLLFVCWVGVWGFDVPFAGGLGVGGFGVCLLGHWLQCLLTWLVRCGGFGIPLLDVLAIRFLICSYRVCWGWGYWCLLLGLLTPRV